jgi:DNA-binding IclR family transcriptional regulator
MIKRKSVAISLERGLDLLHLLSKRQNSGATARELGAAFGIPQASLYRLLKVLTDRGFVFQDPASGFYRLSHTAMGLGFSARAASPLVGFVQPLLCEISRCTHQMSECAVAAGGRHLQMIDTWQAERTPPRVAPRHVLSTGPAQRTRTVLPGVRR